MKNSHTIGRPINLIAADYFEYLGTHLPQLCANDEFYFLPRSEVAPRNLDRLDDLSQDRVQDHIRYVRGLLGEISRGGPGNLEAQIDRLLLQQSMESFIREFDEEKVWRNDPTLYIKLPLFATDQIVSQSDHARDHLRSDLLAILGQIPSFLSSAMNNLRGSSEIRLRVASEMAQDASHFFYHDLQAYVSKALGEDEELLSKNRQALEAVEKYKEALSRLPSTKTFAVGKDRLERILAISLRYMKSADEILEIAQDAYHKIHESLCRLARDIDRRKDWRLLISEQAPSRISTGEIMRLYKSEVQGLRHFFYSQNLLHMPCDEEVIVLETPSYLKSLRATASYRAPLTGQTKDRGLFYITPGKEDLELISVHCPYLCAHETYPGHHVLDNLRINQSNPIRRQIESPLFYEGWSCYGEQLLDDLGYIKDPRRQLVGLKRRLWRTVRAALDVELQTGRISMVEGAERIEKIGFSTKRALRQIRRFALTPGYQLCYFMGNHEILGLRERFFSRLGPKAFHEALLGGGQIPFHLVERRLEADGPAS
jgi:hypothetical protein